MSKYNPQKIEKKWQKYWEVNKLHEAGNFATGKRNFMLLVEFPYPSGNLHTGHWYAFAVPDIYGRYLSMNGYNVMYPIGFDAFGLPAENAAIKNGVHPRVWTKGNIKTMTRQLKQMGARFDWTREVSTIEPEYYKWTQWIFLQLYKAGLAYRAKTAVNWCPHDKTVLANEQVIDGKCDRCGNVVEQKELSQWMFKITSFADRLVDDLKDLDWPEATKKAQENWIGRSEGAIITFPITGGKAHINVFTTRPDTIFGATFLVVSPEMAQKWIDGGGKAEQDVKDYITASFKKTELQRQETREKTGVDTGAKAINPMTQEEIPIWVADYVLGHYGTGQIMAVPAHDERDKEFAQKFNLPIKEVIDEHGMLVQSGNFTGMPSEEAKKKIVEALKEKGLAEAKRNYRLHDWILSRQRYWGAPIPMIHCATCGYVPVPEEKLPVKLPPLEDFKPADDGSPRFAGEAGRSPLAKAEKWLKVKCPQCGKWAERETDTMDTFVDSSWYFMRYADPANADVFAETGKMKNWLPVPLYFGGAEHNTMHLLYSRFVTKALRSLNLVDFSEPFLSRRNHGLILGPDGQKMSKSKDNVVDPDAEVAEHGADALRMYLAFMGPYAETTLPWNPAGVAATFRFLNRFWNFVSRYGDKKARVADQKDIPLLIHQSVKDVGEDIKQHKFNTGVSTFMKLLNALEEKTGTDKLDKPHYEIMVKLIAPYAPHMAEELWSGVLGNEASVHSSIWPQYDEALLDQQMISIIVQVNGTYRATLTVQPEMDQESISHLAQTDGTVVRALANDEIKKVIFVPRKLINFVTEKLTRK